MGDLAGLKKALFGGSRSGKTTAHNHAIQGGNMATTTVGQALGGALGVNQASVNNHIQIHFPLLAGL